MSGTDDIQQEIGHLARKMEDAWNNGDSHAYAESFHDDADFVDALGRMSREKQMIGRVHQNNFDTIHKGSQLRMDVLDWSELAPSVALAHVTSELHVPQGPLQGEHRATQTWLVEQIEEAWRVRAFHLTFVGEIEGVPALDQ